MHLTVVLKMNFVNILLWAFTIFLEGKTGKSSQPRYSSASTLFQRELRWLIEKVHPINRTSSAETFQDDSNILKTRKAFAAAERAIGKTVGKRSSLGRDFLKRVTSLIKEKEDSSIKSSGPAKVVFLLDGSGDIGFKEIESYKLFVKDVYENLDIPPSGLTFGILECGSRHYSQRHILTRTVQSSNRLDVSLERLVPANGSCKLGQSLQMINKNIFKTLPSGTPKALVVVLAGKSLDDAASVAKELSKKGVRIVAFGAGDHADMKQLASITDSPLYAFKVPKLKYLPSMSSTVVGFIDKATEPKFLNNEEASSDLTGSSDEVKQASYRDSNDTGLKDIGEPPYSDDDLLHSIPPILDQLERHKPDSWISALESDSMRQADDSGVSQNVLSSETPLPAKALDVPPTQVHASNQVGAAQSDGNFAGSELTSTTRKEKNNFHDIIIIENNAPSTQGNSPSSNQGPGQIPSNNSSPISPMTPAQGAPSQVSLSQVASNQSNEVSGAKSPAFSAKPSQVGGASSPGTNGASPNQLGGNQGKEVLGAVPPPAGGAINPNKALTSGNSGVTAGSTGISVGAPSNPAEPNGPVQVVQAQLLPIPVLSIQAIPIQAIQSSGGKNQPSLPVANQVSQGNINESNSSEVGSRGENNQNQRVPTRTPVPTGGNLIGQSKTGQGAPVLPTTKQRNPSPSGSVNKTTPNPGTNIPSQLTTSAPKSPAGGENTSSSSNSGKPKNRKSHPLTTSPEGKSPASHKNVSGNLAESKNKPTPNPAAAGSPAFGETSSKKPNGAPTAKPIQQQPLVLCQIICGPGCCLVSSKPTTKKLTIPTSKTTTPPTKAKSTKPTTESAPEVIAGPPIAFPYPHQPEWFPQGSHPIPQEPIPVLPNPLHAPLNSPSEPISSPIQLPMYMTLPPATASPQRISHHGRNHPLFAGHCHDVHPDCDTFVMNGMCDQSLPSKEIFNVLELCKQSCGVCNSFINHSQDVSSDSSNKGKEPEDIGFPEYSKKFLKRQVRGMQTTREKYVEDN